MGFILKLVLNAAGIFIIGYLLKGIQIKNFLTALGVAILLGLINTFIKPILLFLTFPLTIIIFGLFIWVINALIIMLVDALVEGMEIKNFWWALLFSFLLSLLNIGFF